MINVVGTYILITTQFSDLYLLCIIILCINTDIILNDVFSGNYMCKNDVIIHHFTDTLAPSSGSIWWATRLRIYLYLWLALKSYRSLNASGSTGKVSESVIPLMTQSVLFLIDVMGSMTAHIYTYGWISEFHVFMYKQAISPWQWSKSLKQWTNRIILTRLITWEDLTAFTFCERSNLIHSHILISFHTYKYRIF